MKPDDRIRLRHIVDALNSTIRFTVGRRRGDLDEDEMLARSRLWPSFETRARSQACADCVNLSARARSSQDEVD